MTEKNQPTSVRLISWTDRPIETIYAQWHSSRYEGRTPTAEEVSARIRKERLGSVPGAAEAAGSCLPPDPRVDWTRPLHPSQEMGPFEAEVRRVADEVLRMNMPLAETLTFTFEIENCPVALREQMVRHRIGHKFGDRFAADIVPDGAGGSWWSQTTRTMNLGSFATDGQYAVPDAVRGNETPVPGHEPSDDVRGLMSLLTRSEAALGEALGLLKRLRLDDALDPYEGVDEQTNIEVLLHELDAEVRRRRTDPNSQTVEEFYHQQMRWIQAAYRRLNKAGLALEDARMVLPMALSHRIVWTTNAAALRHVLKRRSCWISQLGLWEPVVFGMTQELRSKVYSGFAALADPPCVRGGEDGWHGCPFDEEARDLYSRDVDLPPCSLWHHNHPEGRAAGRAVPLRVLGRYVDRQARYKQLWGRDPETAALIDPNAPAGEEVPL